LARLKAPHNNNATTVTFGVGGTHVYADGKVAGVTTTCKNNGG